MKKPSVTIILLLCFSSIILTNTYGQQQQRETITPDEPMYSTVSLVSPLGNFRLGFFTPGSSRNRYLGIQYNSIADPAVVWVGNRQNGIPPDVGGLLKLDANGTLRLVNDNSSVVYWFSEGTGGSSSSPLARLLDTGNLQVVDGGAGNRILWQSFDHPSDTILPGLSVGVDRVKGLDQRVTAWKSEDDPALGDYSLHMDTRGVPQIILTGAGGRMAWRSGPWNGQRFGGIPGMQSYNTFNFSFISDPTRGVLFEYATTNASMITRLVLNSTGVFQHLIWIEPKRVWSAFLMAPNDQCDSVNHCGPYGVCDANNAYICSCLQGFQSQIARDWNFRDGSDGCFRQTATDCTNGTDGFVRVSGTKLPDTSNATLVGKGSMGLDQCRAECLRNCSCTAYAAADITAPYGQRGCIIWTSDLTDLRVYANGGQDLYVRLADKDLVPGSSSSERQRLIVILVPVLAGAALLGCVGWVCHQCNKRSKRKIPRGTVRKREHRDYKYNINIAESEEALQDLDLPLFEFSDVMVATDHFSDQNKLGKGGFGPVYKGRLEDGQDVAIKRLARNSLQGTDEFKNEVILIAKLQHRNLVRILGCCIQGEERMLIYEYMPNGSLDSLLFDKEKAASLDWNARYRIIVGVARGLLYLHHDSRLRVIHRDLKASNVLLDKDLLPKISDFGMARIFGGDETEANTMRVVGTYGYMSPEYAMEGIFSIKSDVFSFGVLVLEIVSGMRNRSVFHAQTQQNLLGQVWSLWKEGAVLELVDKPPGHSSSTSEVMKCVGIGLLCVQEHPEDRPTMSSVVSMLGSDSALLPQPKQSGFTIARSTFEKDSSSGNHEPGSVNQITVSMFQGR